MTEIYLRRTVPSFDIPNLNYSVVCFGVKLKVLHYSRGYQGVAIKPIHIISFNLSYSVWRLNCLYGKYNYKT